MKMKIGKTYNLTAKQKSLVMNIKTEPELNIRKNRIIEALQCRTMPQKFDSVPLNIEKTMEMLQISIKNQQKQIVRMEKATINPLNEMKLKVLENWELTKRKAIEKLAEEIEELQEIEERIEQKENNLAERGLTINELLFKSFCEGNIDMNSTSMPKQELKTDTKKRKSISVEHKNSTAVLKKTKSNCSDEDEMVVIGPNGTKISKSALNSINWSLSGAAVTRKILMEVFDRETLAFHTLTGKPSPAFLDCDKPLKNRLDPHKVEDITHIITMKLNMTPKEVRSAITTKCADENKMYRQREKKRLSMEGVKHRVK